MIFSQPSWVYLNKKATWATDQKPLYHFSVPYPSWHPQRIYQLDVYLPGGFFARLSHLWSNLQDCWVWWTFEKPCHHWLRLGVVRGFCTPDPVRKDLCLNQTWPAGKSDTTVNHIFCFFHTLPWFHHLGCKCFFAKKIIIWNCFYIINDIASISLLYKK